MRALHGMATVARLLLLLLLLFGPNLALQILLVLWHDIGQISPRVSG